MLNHWSGMGRLKAKPELNKTGSGKSVCSFTLAVQRDVSRQAEENAVDWINCVAWDKKAEQITQHFDKGDPIVVAGRIQTRQWEDMKKQTRTATEVVVENYYYPIKARAKGPDVEADEFDGTAPSRPRSNRSARFTELPEDDGDLPF